MADNERIRLLQTTPFFGAVTDQSIALILNQSQTLHLAPGEYFFHQGESADSLYLLEKGEIAIFKTCHDKEYTVRNAEEGDCFGELSLIDLEPRSASVRAESACTAIKIPASALHSLYLHDVEQFLIIQMNMAREVSRRLRASDDRWFELQVETNSSLSC